ncbi:MAG: apolipoprotein N-acyltransferase [Pseudomonadales bacterium]
MIRPLAALAAGGLLPLSMAPFGLWPLGPVSLALWFVLLMSGGAGRDRGLLTGWLYGLGLYGVGVSWVYFSIHDYGHASPLLAGFLVVLFAGGMALFPMLAAGIFRWLNPPGGERDADWVRGGAWFVILVLALEWLLTWFLTGFPWLAAGYGQIDSPLAGFAPVGGVALVSAMTLVSAVGFVLTGRLLRSGGGVWPRLAVLWKTPWPALAVLPWLLGAVLSMITWTQPGPPRTAALVQGNVPQTVKWEPDQQLPIIRHYRTLTEPHWGADLILWPEAALTVFDHQAAELLAVLDERGKAAGSALVLGLPAVEIHPGGDYDFLNTARGLGTADGRYVKRRLVPFGEYVPMEGLLRGVIEFFDLPMSHARAGAWLQPPLTVNGARVSMAICYEIVYPELVRDDVDVLLTISNDTWFGDSIGPWQHLAIARMRALENGRWLLRATNNGVTAIVDDRGEVRGRLPQFEAGVLSGTYREMRGHTPFNRFGPWPLYALLLVVVAVLTYRKTGRGRGPGR